MFWYLFVLAVLALLALNERGEQRRPGIIAAIILAGFAGLRYETGFDWLEYEFLYTYAAPLGVINTYLGVGSIDVEPGYVLAMGLSKTLGLGFQTFIFAISVFNIYLIYKTCSRHTRYIALVLVWYYGFLFTSAQMSTIRQGLSISFILGGLLLRDRGRPILAVPVGLISIAFHSFSIIFVPFLVVTRRPPGWIVVALACLPGILLHLLGISVFELVVRLATPIFGGGLVGDKLLLYGQSSGAELSPFVLVLVGWHLFFLRCNQIDFGPESESYLFRVFTSWMAVLNVIAHAYVADFPVIWNRVMLVSFFTEAIVLTMLYRRQLTEPTFRIMMVTAASLGATISLVYALSHSQALAFKPYQTMAVVWFRGHYGDGRARYEVVRGEIDRAAAESRSASAQ